MKKFIVVILVLAMCISICSCGKSEEVKNVEAMISAIGTVSQSSESAILDAERAYGMLSSDDKEKVSNYNVLLEARAAYNAIPKVIQLTPSNFNRYFSVTCEYGELETHRALGISFADIDVNVNVRQTFSGSLDNVRVTLKIINPSGWVINSNDRAYSSASSDKEEFTISFSMPVSGEHSETHSIGKAIESRAPVSNCRVEIIAVSGTITEK